MARVRDGKARSRIFIGRLKACGMHWMAQSLLDTPTSPRYGAHPPEQHPSSIQFFVEEFGEAFLWNDIHAAGLTLTPKLL